MRMMRITVTIGVQCNSSSSSSSRANRLFMIQLGIGGKIGIVGMRGRVLLVKLLELVLVLVLWWIGQCSNLVLELLVCL